MKIVTTQFYIDQLKKILRYIALDQPQNALAFERELQKKLEVIKKQPEICRTSHYHENPNYRDLIHKGFTIIYKIESNQILLLDIFKWQAREPE
jgi:plasmid stabilization system protein ParE